MGHLLCFYLLELGMAAAWCRWVICREVDLPALLRTARTVWSGERQVLGELLLVRRRWTEGEETERFRQAWRRIALRLLPPLLYLTLGGALAPVLAWRMFPEGAGQLAMGCCVLAGLAGGCFKAGTQRTVEELSWMQGELEGLRSRPGFLKEHTRPVEWDQKKRGLLVLLLLAAAAVALLAVTVSAAVLWLTPAQVAEELNDPMLAEAFQSEAAVILNETQTVGDYTVTLMGMVSGANISQWCADVQESRTYAVVSVVRTDGTPLTEENYDVVPCGAFTVTPLVSGYDPRAVNVFTLNGACSSFLRDGRAYYVLDTQSLEIFSDHTVYLALYEGFAAPSYERFSLAEDGTVDLRDNVTGCMFTLPLDTHTADPDAARAFVESTGIPWEPMTDAQLAVQEAHEDLEVEKSADGVGNQTFLIQEAN